MTAVGALYTWQASRLPLGDPIGSGEGGVPVIVGTLWVIFGLFITVRTPPLHESNEEVGTWPDIGSVGRLAISLLLCIGFIAVLNSLGIILTSIIFLTLMARLCGAPWSKSAILGVIMSICFWLLFVKLLQLSLPSGSIPAMIWRA